jgi:hypothetical protein
MKALIAFLVISFLDPVHLVWKFFNEETYFKKETLHPYFQGQIFFSGLGGKQYFAAILCMKYHSEIPLNK